MIPIGQGVAVGLQGGMLHAVTGSLWAQIERERADGPRWAEAVRESRRLRERATERETFPAWSNLPTEYVRGIPVGWITR